MLLLVTLDSSPDSKRLMVLTGSKIIVKKKEKKKERVPWILNVAANEIWFIYVLCLHLQKVRTDSKR